MNALEIDKVDPGSVAKIDDAVSVVGQYELICALTDDAPRGQGNGPIRSRLQRPKGLIELDGIDPAAPIPAVHHVRAVTSHIGHDIMAGTASQGVVAGAAGHGVVAGAAIEHVAAGVAGEDIVERVAGGVDGSRSGQVRFSTLAPSA